MSVNEAALQAVEDWQRRLVEHRRAERNTIERVVAQQSLVKQLNGPAPTEALLDSIADGGSGGSRQMVSDAAEAMPVMSQPVSAEELDYPQWSTDSLIHRSLSENGMTRAIASDYRCWHLVTIKMLNLGLLPHSTWMLGGRLPRVLTEESPQAISDDNQLSKQLDEFTRNVLRRGGGICVRKALFHLDGMIPRAWWRAEIATDAAAVEPSLNAQDVYDRVLRPVGNTTLWRRWAEAAARSGTRLAAPNVVAGLALARIANPLAASHAQVLRLLRRTMHVDVRQVQPAVLAVLAN